MASFGWEVPFLVAVIVVAILYVSGRTNRGPGEPAAVPGSDADVIERTDGSPGRPSSGHELIEQLERTLGMAILVESVDPAEPVEPDGSVTLHARFLFGRYTTEVAVTGDSESTAWEELGRAAIAWRSSDYQHIQMWPGGG
jgi:hypothetical protein